MDKAFPGRSHLFLDPNLKPTHLTQTHSFIPPRVLLLTAPRSEYRQWRRLSDRAFCHSSIVLSKLGSRDEMEDARWRFCTNGTSTPSASSAVMALVEMMKAGGKAQVGVVLNVLLHFSRFKGSGTKPHFHVTARLPVGISLREYLPHLCTRHAPTAPFKRARGHAWPSLASMQC